jgi:hypothetical protein
MSLKLSRRQMAVGIAAAVPLLSQNPATPPQADDVTIAREISKKNRDLIANFKVPVATEPSFIFKA